VVEGEKKSEPFYLDMLRSVSGGNDEETSRSFLLLELC
jgi:hypothetical protein